MLFPGCGEAVSRKASRWARHLQITTYCPEPVLHQARKQKQHFPRQQSQHPQAPPPRPQETLSAFSRLSCDPTSDWWDEAQGCHAAGCECNTRGAGSAPGKPSCGVGVGRCCPLTSGAPRGLTAETSELNSKHARVQRRGGVIYV